MKNELLKLVYVEGMTYTEAGRRHKLGGTTVERMAREALWHVAFYQEHPERALELAPKAFDPDFQRFLMAESVEEKRFTAKQHPELKVLLEKLTKCEAQALYALYWDDLTLAEAGGHMGVTRKRVRQLANKGLRKLMYHDSRKLQWREDEARRDDLVHALGQLPTLAETASALELSPKELPGCLRRLDIAPSVASPRRAIEDDPRVEALRAARTHADRRRVAAAHPESGHRTCFLMSMRTRRLRGCTGRVCRTRRR